MSTAQAVTSDLSTGSSTAPAHTLVEEADSAADRPGTSSNPRRLGGWLLRASVILSVLPLATLVDRPTGIRVGLAAALVWVPTTSALDAWARRRPTVVPDALAVAVDWSMLIALAGLVPDAASMAALGSLAIVAWWVSVDARLLGAAAALLSVVPVTIALRTYEAPMAIIVGAPFVFLVVVGAIFWIQRESARERRSATANLHRMRRRSSAILTGVGEAVVVTDARGIVREVNRAGHNVLGLPDGTPGTHCSIALGLRVGNKQLDCADGCALLALGGADAGDAQVSRPLADGVEQPLLAGAQVVGEGRHAEVVHSFRDITRLRQAEEAKSLFLATASHELKTPITVIQGFTEILLSGRANGVAMEQEALHAVHRRSHELARIVDRLLLSSRIEHGHVDLTPVPIEVGHVLAERTEALDSVLPHPIRLESDDDLPVVFGDETALATVLDHLLENAVKYSPEPTPVLVTARRAEDGLTISVQDRGIGMTPEQITHCFEQFWQAEASDVRKYGGTGIGLYIVHSLVTAMRGTIEVASTPGGGATFVIGLTSREADGEDRPPAPLVVNDAPDSIIQEFMRQIGVGAPVIAARGSGKVTP